MTITNCKVNHLDNPLGYALDGTTFSWVVEGAAGKLQTAARIVVKRGGTVEADTGWADLDSLATPVELSLVPRTRYTWTVSVRTDAGEEQTSGENWFETGKLDEPWAAGWIGCDDSQPRHPVFSREITPVKPVAAARLYVCGLGLYECAWNGEKISGEYLAPYCNDYNSWVQYQTYDVTQQLQTAGTLSVTLGNGWYRGRFGYDNHTGKPHYGDSWKLIAELRLTYADGTEEVIGTDEGWTAARSNITFSNIYDGEHRDDILPFLPPEEARLVEPPAGALTARYSTPVAVREELPVKELLHTPAGETVLDLGQNLAGIFRLRCHAPKGQTIRLQFGEILQGGNFYRDNLRSAKAEYVYVSDGKKHVIEPKFTYYGYRYVKVEGLPDLKPEDFTALVLHSELPQTGTLATGNELVNRLLCNIQWGQKGNFLDVPTDCPQRDERMGWTGDAQVFAPTACYQRDCYAFYAKYLHDLALEQSHTGGAVPNVIPSFDHRDCSAAWGDAAFELLLNEGYPGWLYAVKLGATTVWERWNSVGPDGVIADNGMNSLNHYAYGSIAQWLYGDVAGLRPAAPGFRRARLSPHVHAALGHGSLEYQSAAGVWKCRWEVLDNGDVAYSCTVPLGCTAELTLPYGGGTYELGPGEFSHTYTPDRPLRGRFSTNTPLGELLSSPRAKALLERTMPQITQLPPSMGGMTMRQLAQRMGGRIPAGALDKIDAMLAKL